MQRLLRQWGYGLELAGTGAEAMAWLELSGDSENWSGRVVVTGL